MKLLAAIGTTGLFLLFGTTAAAYAPQDRPEQQDEKAKPEKQDEKAKPEKQNEKAQPAKQDEKAKPAKQEEKAAKPEAKQSKPEERDKPAKQDARQTKPEQQDKPAKQDGQQQEKQSAQQSPRDAENRAGGGHGRITDQHYSASFGSEHHFRVNRGDYDNRRFEYGGYSFGFIDPWPSAWYYSDDVYVVYDNGGYYMYDAVHPGIRISVSIL
jgi:outer membrane biosynthesis protein TonB